MKILFLIFLTISMAHASSVHLDLGQTKTNFNRFRIPNNEDDQITTPSGEALSSYRLTGYFDMGKNNQLYFLWAPLTAHYSFTSDKNFTFDDTNFSQGQKTDVKYKFNSYRLGYLWNWQLTRLRYWLGVVAKVRDAKIEVSQGNTSESYDNLGVVPLFALGFEWALTKNLRVFSHTDALGSSQGSAYDSQLELKWKLNQYAMSLGKRILGGGADNDEVYTFAQFDAYYLRASIFF